MNYNDLCTQLGRLIEGSAFDVTNLANASALLFDAMPEINWAGFYLAEGQMLYLGPFQGKPACMQIPFGKGVCGTAAGSDKTVIVPDVHAFSGHIACDAASRSEIVIPIHAVDELYGVLDIDSPIKGRFDKSDQTGLEAFVKVLESGIGYQLLLR